MLPKSRWRHNNKACRIMSHKRSVVSHAKEIYYILCIVVFVVSALFTVWGPGGYLEMREAKLELDAHRARVTSLKRSNNERLQSIEALRSDKEALEKFARKQGYARKDEIIQQLPEEAPAPQLPAPPAKR